MEIENFDEHNALLVIGNGFDLDLGLKTSYKDFVNNELCDGEGRFPFVKGGHNGMLGEYILRATNIDKWFDLENILAEFACQSSIPSSVGIDSIRDDYRSLKQALQQYLKSIDVSASDKESSACKIIKALSGFTIMPPEVYTFNYTDFSRICESLDVHGFGRENYVHGSLEGDIVFGVGDSFSLSRDLSFLYKTNNPEYRSSCLQDALETSDVVVIFGLSLSEIDYPYFNDFFKHVSEGKFVKRKYIRIFTYDETSKRDIMYNLRQMNKGLIRLFSYSDFEVVMTKEGCDQKKIDEVIEFLSNT